MTTARAIAARCCTRLRRMPPVIAYGRLPATAGFSPLAFDFKANFWEENTRYHIPAFGVELYLQTTFGSPAFNGGTQPSINLLFDQSLPLGIGFEYNLGIAGIHPEIWPVRAHQSGIRVTDV